MGSVGLCWWCLATIAIWASVWATPARDPFNRLKRQSCGFRCKSGTCIDNSAMCDGAVDCPDESDESAETCLNFSKNCPAYSEKCDYGACVDADAKCNGKKDCADGSDEKNCGFKDNIKKCSADQFKCKDDSCVNIELSCDGKKDCADGSDETELQCKSISCPPFAFSCDYGACIDRSAICDGRQDCADGSDEKPSLCSEKVEPPPVTSCKDPPGIENGHVSRNMHKASYSCNEGHHLIGSAASTCTGGTWTESPTCIECGKRSNKFGAAAFILKGEEAEYEEFPWNVAIYEDKGNDFMDLICGGTLISLRTVVSAAHCFWDESLRASKSASRYRIAIGKFNSDWSVKETGLQVFEIFNITAHFMYIGPARHYSNDIAVVTLRTEVKFSRAVRPACIDWNKDFQPKPGESALIAGWGKNELNTRPEKLQKVRLTVRDFNTCVEKLPEKFVQFLTNDKFCAGHLNGTGVCQGDSGSGLTFKNPKTGGFYLWGIVSVGVVQEESCSLKDYTTFVDIYEYISWLKSNYV